MQSVFARLECAQHDINMQRTFVIASHAYEQVCDAKEAVASCDEAVMHTCLVLLLKVAPRLTTSPMPQARRPALVPPCTHQSALDLEGR